MITLQMNKAQMRDIRTCPECGAEKGMACRKPSCPQLQPICNNSENGKHHYKYKDTGLQHVDYHKCVHCGDEVIEMRYDIGTIVVGK